MQAEQAFGMGVGLFLILLYLLFVVGMLTLMVLVVWKLTAKTGYPGALGLLYFVPIANLVFLLILAFGEWPIHRELKMLKGMLPARGGGAVPPAPGIRAAGR